MVNDPLAPRSIIQADEYEQYYAPSVLVYATPPLLERAAPRPGERVLDVACGTGIAARMAAPMVEPRGEVVGVDASPDMLRVARRSSGNEAILWKEAALENLPFRSRTFDLALCQHGLETLGDRLAILYEMHRVLKPGGRAAISLWQSLEQNPVIQIIEEVIAQNIRRPVPLLSRSFSCGNCDEVSDWLTQAGFRRVRVFPVTHPVRFADSPRFIEFIIRFSTSMMPVYAEGLTIANRALFQKIAYEIAWVVQKFTHHNTLRFNMSANIFVAIR